MNEDKLPVITVEKIVDHEDGSATIVFNPSPHFVKWFLEDQRLKRWSQKRFNKWIMTCLEDAALQRVSHELTENLIKMEEKSAEVG